MEFFPSNKRTPEYFNSVFQERNLAEIVRLQKNQASQEMKLNLHKVVSDALDEGKAAKDIIAEVKDYSTKNNLPEHEIVTIVRKMTPGICICKVVDWNCIWLFYIFLQVWGTLMAAVEWNKKEELVAEQALKHIKVSIINWFLDIYIWTNNQNIFCL